jgi:hypothetical protein
MEGSIGLRQRLSEVLAESARVPVSTRLTSADRLVEVFSDLERALKDHPAVKEQRALFVRTNCHDRWRKLECPHVSIRARKDGPAADQSRAFVAYALSADSTEVGLAIIHTILGRRKAHPGDPLRQRQSLEQATAQATVLLTHDALVDRGFRIGPGGLDLGAEQPWGADYETAAMAWKLYSASSLPAETELDADLRATLSTYLDFTSRESELGTDTLAADAETDNGNMADRPALIYQTNRERFDLEKALASIDTLHWSINHAVASRLQPGDRVFLWEAGDKGGLRGSARVDGQPNVWEVPLKERPLHVDRGYERPGVLRMRLRVEHRLTEPLSRDRLRADPALASTPFFLRGVRHNPVEVTPEEATALLAHVQEHAVEQPLGDRARVNWTVPIEQAATFETVGRYLRSSELYVPDELLSNYLLALQTKRFVILSGISGTGKTQVALRVAECFQKQAPRQLTEDVPPGAHVITATQKMLERPRVTLPVALREELAPLIPETERSSGQLPVKFPGGTMALTYYRSPSSPRTLVLLFKGGFSEWFRSNVGVGDRFFAKPEESPDGTPTHLLFGVPLPKPPVQDTSATLDTVCAIAVRPDWTDNRGLLGYFNPVLERYIPTPFLRFLLNAAAEEQRAAQESRSSAPFFAILDEMNLARVEHYFSDFLSSLESGQPLHLHNDERTEAGETEDGTAIPRELQVPANVYFTGTVNVDETTYMFSPKVLDRAFVIEFDRVDLDAYGSDPADEPLGTPNETASAPLRLTGFTNLGRWRAPAERDWLAFQRLPQEKEGRSPAALLRELHKALQVEHRHFGFRVANEIARFVTLAADQAPTGDDAVWRAFDLAVLEKVLPKFHGTQRELGRPLDAVFHFALYGRPPTACPARVK